MGIVPFVKKSNELQPQAWRQVSIANICADERKAFQCCQIVQKSERWYLSTLVERQPFEGSNNPCFVMVRDLGAVSEFQRFHNTIHKER
jgi:hypothetical protein